MDFTPSTTENTDYSWTRSFWDHEGEEPPGTDADPSDQAGHVLDLTLGYFYPDVPKPSDFELFASDEGYSWPTVRMALAKLGAFWPLRRAVAEPNLEPTETDVRITLIKERKGRVIRTLIDHWVRHHEYLEYEVTEGERESLECVAGKGILLRKRSDPFYGRDAQTRCKQRTCRACGPRDRAHKISSMRNSFGPDPIHAIDFGPGEALELKTFIKKLNRKGENYYSIPAPDGLTIVLTKYDVGEVISRQDMEDLVDLQPLDRKRRLSTSRAWKFSDDSRTKDYQLAALSDAHPDHRQRTYRDAGLEPEEIPHSDYFVSSHHIPIPAAGTLEMDQFELDHDWRPFDNVKRDRWGEPIGL